MGLLSSISDLVKTVAPLIPVYGPAIGAAALVFDQAWKIAEPMADKFVQNSGLSNDFKTAWEGL